MHIDEQMERMEEALRLNGPQHAPVLYADTEPAGGALVEEDGETGLVAPNGLALEDQIVAAERIH